MKKTLISVKWDPLVDLSIPLISTDILWEEHLIPIIWVNQMYTSWKRWNKRLTFDAVKYKSYLRNKIKEYLLEHNHQEISKNVFYILVIDLKVPLTQSWKINNTYKRDLDNLLKPIQDELSSQWLNDIRIWKDDKLVLSELACLRYNENIPWIHLRIYDLDDIIFDF